MADHHTTRRRVLTTPLAVAATVATAVGCTPTEPNRRPGTPADTRSLRQRIADSAAARRTAEIRGSVQAGPKLVIDQPVVRLRGVGDAEIRLASSSIGLEITPPKEPVGSVVPAALGAEVIRVRAARWHAGEHVGKWVELTDPAADPRTQSRRVIDNSRDTLMIEHPLGRALPTGCTASLVTPLEEVVIENLSLVRNAPGGSNLVIRFCKNVLLTDVASVNAGDQRAQRGNAVSVYQCDRVDLRRVSATRSGNFGLFVYNSDNITVGECRARGWHGFGIQLKDCRSGLVDSCTCTADGTSGDNGFSLKCSGLNPASALRATNCTAKDTRLASFEFSSITNEGGWFAASDFTFDGCRSLASRTHGFSTVLDDRATPEAWRWVDCTAVGAHRVGFTRPGPAHQIVGCVARHNGHEGMSITRPGVNVVGGTLEDNCQRRGGPASSEIAVEADDVTIQDTRFVRTLAGRALTAVQSLQAARTHIKSCIVEDQSGRYATAFQVAGPGSVVEQ